MLQSPQNLSEAILISCWRESNRERLTFCQSARHAWTRKCFKCSCSRSCSALPSGRRNRCLTSDSSGGGGGGHDLCWQHRARLSGCSNRHQPTVHKFDACIEAKLVRMDVRFYGSDCTISMIGRSDVIPCSAFFGVLPVSSDSSCILTVFALHLSLPRLVSR